MKTTATRNRVAVILSADTRRSVVGRRAPASPLPRTDDPARQQFPDRPGREAIPGRAGKPSLPGTAPGDSRDRTFTMRRSPRPRTAVRGSGARRCRSLYRAKRTAGNPAGTTTLRQELSYVRIGNQMRLLFPAQPFPPP